MFGMIEEYLVEYSYKKDGKRKYEKDIVCTYSADRAAEAVRDELDDLGFNDGRIECVYKDCDTEWRIADWA